MQECFTITIISTKTCYIFRQFYIALYAKNDFSFVLLYALYAHLNTPAMKIISL